MESLLVEQNQNKNVVDWEQNAVKRGRYKNWKVPIGITGFRFINCVIPVDKQYEPTEEETDFCLYLHGDKRLYFKMNPSLLDLSDDEWLAYQASKGNTLRSIRDELYVLSPKQQNMMNQIKQMEEKMKKRINARWESKYSELELEHVTLQTKHVTLEKERDALKIELNVVNSIFSELKKVLLELPMNALAIMADLIAKRAPDFSHT
ncbi:hypothetical protein AVEN_156866-1 [Araneus ventricosus]|uniref:Uncharacterized protein n=1 Tax=Araneus ventricosus TaxID=182803 RepID=A0A4Y2LRD6_ARAVE|nr:hypothetical protein AVEN_156866-1 [Araneus ventricosus]